MCVSVKLEFDYSYFFVSYFMFNLLLLFVIDWEEIWFNLLDIILVSIFLISRKWDKKKLKLIVIIMDWFFDKLFLFKYNFDY